MLGSAGSTGVVITTTLIFFAAIWLVLALPVWALFKRAPETRDRAGIAFIPIYSGWVLIADVAGLGSNWAAAIIIGGMIPFVGIIAIAGWIYAWVKLIERFQRSYWWIAGLLVPVVGMYVFAFTCPEITDWQTSGFCPSCGTPRPASGRFCAACGNVL